MDEQMKYFFEVYCTLPRAGPGDKVSTAKAYKMIPDLPEEPRILDIGCGPGMQTLELARLSQGLVIALDNHQPFLDKIRTDAKNAGLAKYIEVLNGDMNQMNFPHDSFDLIWSEGALYLMGFENGLKKCRKFLKDNGCVAVTELVWLKENRTPIAKEWAQEYEAMKNVPDNLKLIENCGFEVLGHFTLPVSSWFNDYYNPMQIRINELRPKYKGNKIATQVLDSAQHEIDGFKQCSDQVGYEFFVMRKI